MKYFLITCLLFVCALTTKAQYTYKIKADTVLIYNTCDTAELKLQNRTQNVSGFLYNKGKGVTEFRKLELISIGDSAIAITGQDTLVLRNFGTGGGTAYIQNQSSVNQSASFKIGGSGSILGSLGVGGYIVSSTGFLSHQNTRAGGNGHYQIADSLGRNRWAIGTQNVEGTAGSNIGSDFTIYRYNDAAAAVSSADFFIKRSSGNIGIGTTSPVSKFDVNGDIKSWTGVFRALDNTSPASDTILRWGYNSTVQDFTSLRVPGAAFNTAELRLVKSGYVGIGTPNPGQKLDIVNTDTSNTYAQIRNSTVTSLTGVLGTQGSVLGSISSHPVLFYTAGSEKMRLTAAGNLGLGTTTPTEKLDVNGGNVSIENGYLTVTGGASPGSGGSATINFRTIGNNTNAGYSLIQSFYAGLNYTAPLILLATNGNAIGNVGIGTGAPAQRLDIERTDSANNYIQVGNGKVSTIFGAGGVTGGVMGTFANYPMLFYANSAEKMRLTAAGNLGIGTTAPTHKVEVAGDLYVTTYVSGVLGFGTLAAPTSSGTRLYSINGTDNNSRWSIGTLGVEAGSNVGNDLAIFRYSDAGASLSTNDFFIKRSTGYVGIGTSTPAYKLDVSGTVQATGFYQASLRSLKKNIQPFTASAVKILDAASVRTFEYKADSTNTTHIGFIADEVPDEMASPGRKGVDQANTTALLVKALQEMSAKVEQLEKEIKELKKAQATK